MLIYIEVTLFFIIMAIILKYKVLSKPLLSEGLVGPFNIIYTHHIGSTWSVQKKLKHVRDEMKQHGIDSDRFICIYFDDPTEVKGVNLRSIVGCIVEDEDYIVPESYKYTELSERYVAKICNANKILGFNKTFLFPRLYAYMNVMGYKKASDQVIEIYKMGSGISGFGEGFLTEVCCRVEDKGEEQTIRDLEAEESKRLDMAKLILGKEGRTL